MKKIFILLLILSSNTYSLSCMDTPLEELIEIKDYIYIAKVKSTEFDPSDDTSYLNEMEVIKTLKGVAPTPALLRTFQRKERPKCFQEECGYDYQYPEPKLFTDKEYIIFGEYDYTPVHSLCSIQRTSNPYLIKKIEEFLF